MNSSTSKKKRQYGPSTDRRILRTRDRLGDALIAVMQEKEFEEIVLKDVLERAGVGRSTFYVHYSDKDDLFFSDMEEFLQQVATTLKRQGGDSKRLLPVKEFLAHIRDARGVYEAFVRSGKIHEFRTLGLGVFARSIEERLQTAGVTLDAAMRSAHAHALAGSFFALLDWWIDKGMKAQPTEMDDLFHRLAWRGLKS